MAGSVHTTENTNKEKWKAIEHAFQHVLRELWWITTTPYFTEIKKEIISSVFETFSDLWYVIENW